MEVATTVLVVIAVSIIAKWSFFGSIQFLVSFKWNVVEDEEMAENQDKPMKVELISLLL